MCAKKNRIYLHQNGMNFRRLKNVPGIEFRLTQPVTKIQHYIRIVQYVPVRENKNENENENVKIRMKMRMKTKATNN